MTRLYILTKFTQLLIGWQKGDKRKESKGIWMKHLMVGDFELFYELILKIYASFNWDSHLNFLACIVIFKLILHGPKTPVNMSPRVLRVGNS